MAQILGVSTPTYRKVEAGISTVEWGVILRALQFLELDTDKLLSVFPTQEPPMKLKDLLAPTRKNAYRRKFHGKTNM